MSSNAILFVDDDAAVLGGLRDTLRKFRHCWDMKFVPDAGAAMRELATRPFDVIVSDMRMPNIDGAALLADVKARYPGTARIILSGHADKEAILRTLPVAQQFLTKPCDPEQLRQVVERTCALNALIHNEAIRTLVGGIERLPSAPAIYVAMTQLMADPEVDLDEVVALVERDPALCVKVLQLVNSAYFGLARQMTSVRQAVTYLGLELLKSLALSTQAFAMVDARPCADCDLDRLRNAALLTATLARRFLRATPKADEAFAAGLLHDIGRIVLATVLPPSERERLNRARESGVPLHVVEAQVLGLTHAEVGAYLLGIWGLPVPVVEAAAFHHAPSRVSHGETATLEAVHVASALAYHHLEGGAEPLIDAALLLNRGETIAQWRALAAEELSRRVS